MTAIHLHCESDVGTTYKRALERFHQSRDAVIPRDFSALRLIVRLDNWSVLTRQQEDDPVRKPRDFDAEMKALSDKARLLKERKIHQLGELVIATGADALSIEQLVGLLLAGMKNKDSGAKESWRKRGEDFFQGRTNNTADDTRRDTGGTAQNEGGTTPSGSQSRTS